VAKGAHGLVSTPGATRFYKSGGYPALQQVVAQVSDGARLEWLPLEAIAYNDCEATNRAIFNLESGAELITWDVTALGLPTSNLSFEQGHFQQHLEISGVWLEKGIIRGNDARWLNSPLGLAGQKCLASLVFAAGTAIEPKRAEKALEAAREVIEAHPLKHQAGITFAHPQVIVLRVMSPLVEPTMGLLKQVWATWRHTLWGLPSTPPRIWSV
jgi:urease accessory protein